MVWNKIEKIDVEELREIQLERLQKLVKYVYDKIPHYKRKFDEKGVNPEDIKSLDDIKLLPFTSKEDLRQNYPFDMFAVPLEQVARVHASSGTTGKPTVVGYTANDIKTWAETMARTLGCGNVSKNDIIQNAYGYGLFTGGLGVHYGAEKVGATVIPISGGNTKRQLMIMEDFQSTVITCTPSYACLLAEALDEIDRNKIKLKVGFLGAEPWSDSMRKEIESAINIDALDIYGLSEVIGPGVSSECLAKQGLHICCDHFYPEIINPDTGETLPEGQLGELVFTTLTKECSPYIRYRTRDICSLIYEKCDCGRTHYRMTRVAGRSDDMLIIRGVNIFPSQIESVLVSIEEVEPHYHIIVDRKDKLDVLEVHVEVNERIFSDEVKQLEFISKKIKGEIESTLGISIKVKLVEPKSLQRFEGKAKRVTDNRKI